MLLTVAVAAVALWGLPRAQATSLTPGGSVTPGSTAPSGSNLAVVADSGSLSYTLTNNGTTTGTGTVREYVLKGDTTNSSGGLDFVFQVKVTSGVLSSLSLSDFSGVTKMDASQVSEAITLGSGGTILATGSKKASSVDWSSDGFSVTSNFNPSASSATTYVIVIRTDKTQYTTASIDLQGRGTASKSGFAPTPEPASMVLLGGCFAGLAGAGLWRRVRRRGQAV
jgi:hypothetical protein